MNKILFPRIIRACLYFDKEAVQQYASFKLKNLYSRLLCNYNNICIIILYILINAIPLHG